jgi:hypothetical protein
MSEVLHIQLQMKPQEVISKISNIYFPHNAAKGGNYPLSNITHKPRQPSADDRTRRALNIIHAQHEAWNMPA